jgi:hypothetical protein
MRDWKSDLNREPVEVSDELKRKFALALKGTLKTPNCRDCVRSGGFVSVVEFLIDLWGIAIERIDVASQTMEDFIEIFKELEIREMKARMLGEDDR